MTKTITLDDVSKAYRIYHERNQDLKRRLLRRRRHVFEQFWALKNVSFTVQEGEILGVIGSNGSGKSTLLRLLAGTLQPDGGQVSVVGSVSGLLELGAGFHPELTGRENVFLSGALLGVPRAVLKARFDDIVGFAGIGEFIDNPVKTYSSGMYARLGFAVATNVEPDVLLIDEVLAVGDDEFQRRCLEKVEEMRRAGRTIVVVSHSLELVQTICERVAWIDRGVLQHVGDAHETVAMYQSSFAPTSTDAGGPDDDSLKVRTSVVSPRGPQPATGTPCGFRFEVDAPSDLAFEVQFRIHRTDGVLVGGGQVAQPAASAPSELTYFIDRLPLHPGDYDVEVLLLDTDTRRVHFHEPRSRRFAVVSSEQTTPIGLLDLFGTWETP